MNAMGGETVYDFLRMGQKFTLKDVHDKVKCPVLVLHGERDLFVSDGIQDVMFKNAFKMRRVIPRKLSPSKTAPRSIARSAQSNIR